MENYIKEAVKNSYFVLGMSVLSIAIGYVLRIFLSRSLTLEEFGLFYAVTSFMGVFILLRYLGLNQALAKFIPEFLNRKEYDNVKTIIVLVFVIQILAVVCFSAAVYILRDYINAALFKADAGTTVLTLMVISVFPSMFFALFQSVFQGYQKLKTYALVEPVRISLTFLFAVALIGYGAIGVAMAYVISSVIMTIIFLFPFLGLGITKYKTKFSKEFSKKIFNFTAPVLISSVGIVLLGYTDTLILTFYKTLDEVALYQVALPTSQLLLMFSSSVAAVALPMISALYSQERIADIGKSIKIMTFLLTLVLVPFVILFISSADAIIGVIFGPQFLGASQALQVLSISMFFYSVFVIFQTTLDAIGKPFLNTKIMFIIAAVNIALNILLVPAYGILGSAGASLVSIIVGLTLGFWEVEKHIKSSIQVAKLGFIFVCGMISAGTVYVFNQLISLHIYAELAASMIIGVAVFLLLITTMKLVTKEDVRFVDSVGLSIPRPLRRLANVLLK